jgi:hypothetical protein
MKAVIRPAVWLKSDPSKSEHPDSSTALIAVSSVAQPGSFGAP